MVIISEIEEAREASFSRKEVRKWPGRREGLGELEFELTLEAIGDSQNDIQELNDKAYEEIQAIKCFYNPCLTELYQKRADFTTRRPRFWLSALTKHPRISKVLDDYDYEVLEFLNNIEVEEFRSIHIEYRICFHFSPNKYFRNKVIIKEFFKSDKGKEKSIASKVFWFPLMNFLSITGRTRMNGRPRLICGNPESFFSWIVNNSVSKNDSIARTIKDKVWKNPRNRHMKHGWSLSSRRRNLCPSSMEDFSISVAQIKSIDALEFLRERGVLHRLPPNCPRCSEPMKEKVKGDSKFFMCVTDNQRLSVRYGSCISNTNLTLEQFLIVVFCWVKRIDRFTCSAECGVKYRAISKWYASLSGLCTWFLNRYPRMIGGKGRHVEVDRVSFSYMKGGKEVEQWILCGVDPISRLGFLTPDSEEFDRETKRYLLRKFIVPGSIIHTRDFASCLDIRSIPVKPPYHHKLSDRRHPRFERFSVHSMWQEYQKDFGVDTKTLIFFLDIRLNEFMWRQEFVKGDKESFINILSVIGQWH